MHAYAYTSIWISIELQLHIYVFTPQCTRHLCCDVNSDFTTSTGMEHSHSSTDHGDSVTRRALHLKQQRRLLLEKKRAHRRDELAAYLDGDSTGVPSASEAAAGAGVGKSASEKGGSTAAHESPNSAQSLAARREIMQRLRQEADL